METKIKSYDSLTLDDPLRFLPITYNQNKKASRRALEKKPLMEPKIKSTYRTIDLLYHEQTSFSLGAETSSCRGKGWGDERDVGYKKLILKTKYDVINGYSNYTI